MPQPEMSGQRARTVNIVRGVEQQLPSTLQPDQLEAPRPLHTCQSLFDRGPRHANAQASRGLEHPDRHQGVAHLVLAWKGQRKRSIAVLWRLDEQKFTAIDRKSVV